MRNTSAFQPRESGYALFGSAILAYLKLDDSSGNPVDSFNNANTWTNNNSVSYGTGKLNGGADFGTTGTTKSISTTSVLSAIGAGNFSCNVWVNYTSQPTGQFTIFSIRINGTKNQHEFDYRDESGTKKYNLWTGSTGGTEVKYNITETLSTWVMLTLTYDGSNLRLYRNTSLILTRSTGSNTTGTNLLTIGNQVSDNRQLYGLLDEFSFYNRVITTEEISFLYNSGNAKLYAYGTTSAYYPLNGNANDYSGNQNTGTPTAITYPQGRFGQAAKFNGSSSRIALPTSTAGTFGGSTITISLWVNYLGVTPADFTWLISKCNDGVDFGSWAVWYRTSGTKLVFMTNSDKTNATQALTEKAITIDNKWHNYLFVNNGTNGLIYIDGLLAASGSREDMDSTAQTMTIGASNSGRYSNCLIDEVIIESRAWTAKEVETYYRKSMLNYKQSVWAKFLQAFTISESVSLTESTSNLRARNFSVSETTTLTESITSALGKIVTIVESISLTETLTTTRTFLVNIAESVGLTEVLAQVKKKWSEKTRSSSTWTEKGRSSSTWTEKDRS